MSAKSSNFAPSNENAQIMKTKIYFMMAVVAMICVACNSNPIDSRPINHPTDTPEAVTNDFTLVKACICKTQKDVAEMMESQGYTATGNDGYCKTEDGITKNAKVYYENIDNKDYVCNIELMIKQIDFDTQKAIFSQWMREVQNTDACKSHLIRASYYISIPGNGKQSYSSYEELLSALQATTAPADEGLTAVFAGGDLYANQYYLVLDTYFGEVYMQLVNPRVEEKEEFTESDLREFDLRKDILISKVDYLTFQYRGFYALNVSEKEQNDSLIPIISEYMPAGDFGSIKLYYKNTKDLLLDGTIIWMGMGELSFPESFRAGLPETEGLPYPGKSRIALLDGEGVYVEPDSEFEFQYIWQSISHQKEFQHYYENSTKKIAIYLYTPSVGTGNPADWYYLVYTEQFKN